MGSKSQRVTIAMTLTDNEKLLIAASLRLAGQQRIDLSQTTLDEPWAKQCKQNARVAIRLAQRMGEGQEAR